MKKAAKGSYGYIRYQKKKRILITAVMFLIPLVIFFTGYMQTGTRKNLFTFVAIMGCLPASKCAVSMIMICLQKPMGEKLYQNISGHVRDMTAIYEATVSSYEKNMNFPCIVISGLNVVCYCEDEKVDAAFAQQHIKKILQGNRLRANVKVFHDLKHFLERVDEMYDHREEWEASVSYEPDERYPDLSRNELVKEIILAICL
ncbi:MAG: hypothetical protein Q4C50_01730 [Eubacteriales bacterium]|nr:hypothetical protein [Eubacteriales bacterium]